jgi:hypothetical protein
MSEVKRAEFVSDKMAYVILKSSWRDVIVLNVKKLQCTKLQFCMWFCTGVKLSL